MRKRQSLKCIYLLSYTGFVQDKSLLLLLSHLKTEVHDVSSSPMLNPKSTTKNHHGTAIRYLYFRSQPVEILISVHLNSVT